MEKRLISKPSTARLIDGLDAGYRFWHRDMLRWMISRGLESFGLEPWEKPPEEAKESIDGALNTYRECVAAAEIGTDVLGPVYMALASRWGRDALAQFFTPQNVAVALAMMNLGCSEPESSDAKLIRVLEPAAGSGVMLLAGMQVIATTYDTSALQRYSFTAIDLDGTCARMTALQLLTNCALHDAALGELVVYQGNALGPASALDTIVRAKAIDRGGSAGCGTNRQTASEQLPLFLGGERVEDSRPHGMLGSYGEWHECNRAKQV